MCSRRVVYPLTAVLLETEQRFAEVATTLVGYPRRLTND